MSNDAESPGAPEPTIDDAAVEQAAPSPEAPLTPLTQQDTPHAPPQPLALLQPVDIPPLSFDAAKSHGALPSAAVKTGVPIPSGRRPSARMLLLVGPLVVALVAVGAAIWWSNRAPADDTTSGTLWPSLTREPQQAWAVQVAEHHSEDLSVRAILVMDESKVLVETTLTAKAYNTYVGENALWYPGYDEQYEDGVNAEKRRRAEAESNQELDDYWPTDEYGVSLQDAANDDRFRGWFDGYGGAKKLEKPNPPTIGTVALVDLDAGRLLWSRELADFGVSYEAAREGVETVTFGDTGDIVVAAAAGDDAHPKLDLHVIDAATGEDRTTATVPGTRLVRTHEFPWLLPHAPVVVQGSTDEGSWLAAYSLSTPNSPVWQRRLGAAEDVVLSQTNFAVQGPEEPALVDVSTGFQPAWFDGASIEGSFTAVPYAGGGLIRQVGSDADSMTLTRVDAEGEQVWEVHAGWFGVTVDQESVTVLQAEKAEGDLMTDATLLDLETGAPAWDAPFTQEVTGAFWLTADRAVLHGGQQTFVLDSPTGGEVASVDQTLVGVGESVLYTMDEPADSAITAWSLEGTELWRKDVQGGERLQFIPGRFVLLDPEELIISAWR